MYYDSTYLNFVNTIKKPHNIVVAVVVGANSPTTLVCDLVLLLLSVMAGADHIGAGAMIGRHRMRDRLADRQTGFVQGQLAETFDRNDIAAFAHGFDLVAEELGTNHDLEQTLVAIAVDDRAKFARCRLCDRSLAVGIPLAVPEEADDPTIHLGGGGGCESSSRAFGGEDAIEVCDVHD